MDHKAAGAASTVFAEIRCEPEMLARLHELAEEALREEYHFGGRSYMTLAPGIVIDVLGDLASIRDAASKWRKYARHLPTCGARIAADLMTGSLEIVRCKCGLAELLDSTRVDAPKEPSK